MNHFLLAFIHTGKTLAAARGLTWDPPFAPDGKIERYHRWNLTLLAGLAPPPSFWLSDFGYLRAALRAFNALRQERGLDPMPHAVLTPAWRDLCQAAAINDVLVDRHHPGHAIHKIVRSIRILAMCAPDRTPADITGDDVQLA